MPQGVPRRALNFMVCYEEWEVGGLQQEMSVEMIAADGKQY